jgi:periplasmic divalent cation tolerance protein
VGAIIGLKMHIIYITSASKEEALKISHALVGEGLVACTNIFENMTSVYKWEGQVREETEIVVIAKIADEMVEQVIDRTKQLHSYDCPCIIAIKIDNGSKDFLKWVETSTKLHY